MLYFLLKLLEFAVVRLLLARKQWLLETQASIGTSNTSGGHLPNAHLPFVPDTNKKSVARSGCTRNLWKPTTNNISTQ